MLEVVVLRGCGVVDVEGLFGDEGGDVFVAFVVLAGLLGGLFGRHVGDLGVVACLFVCWYEEVDQDLPAAVAQRVSEASRFEEWR